MNGYHAMRSCLVTSRNRGIRPGDIIHTIHTALTVRRWLLIPADG